MLIITKPMAAAYHIIYQYFRKREQMMYTKESHLQKASWALLKQINNDIPNINWQT